MRQYDLHLTTIPPYFAATCAGCGAPIAPKEPRWADLSGTPWQSWYCRNCAGAIGACSCDIAECSSVRNR